MCINAWARKGGAVASYFELDNIQVASTLSCWKKQIQLSQPFNTLKGHTYLIKQTSGF